MAKYIGVDPNELKVLISDDYETDSSDIIASTKSVNTAVIDIIDYLKTVSQNIESYSGYNYIIDGALDFWYEGTSQSTSGYGSDTMFFNGHVGSTKTHSQGIFSEGGVFPDGTIQPRFYSQTVVTSVVGTTNYCAKVIKLENLKRFSGTQKTFSFYGITNTSVKNIAVEFFAYTGTGGSPTAPQTLGTPQIVSVPLTWTKNTITITFPDMSSWIMGTNEDNYLQITLWMDAGSFFNSRTASLGQQSGTFGFALFKLEDGAVATPYIRDIGLEDVRVSRYFEICYGGCMGYSIAGGYIGAGVAFKSTKRSVPVISRLVDVTIGNVSTPNAEYIQRTGFRAYAQVLVAGTGTFATIYKVDSRL